jgi:DNA-binding CsgD family transcriptional regulator
VERPDQALERTQGLREVLAAVQALPERQREAIVLRELEGRSYEEISSELGVSNGSVRQLLNRARNTLRAGATAVVPVGLVLRLPWVAPAEPLAGRIAELGAGAGAGAVIAKLGATALVTGAVATGVAVAPELGTQERSGGPEKAAASQSPRSGEPAGVVGAGQDLDSSGEDSGDGGGENRSGEGRGERGDDRDDRDDDRSGRRGGDDDGRERDDRSGPEHGDDDQEREDRSGPGDGEEVAEESGQSGSGSGDGGGGDDSDHGGSGSGVSGSGSSGSGSGSSGSGSGSGSGGSGSGG